MKRKIPKWLSIIFIIILGFFALSDFLYFLTILVNNFGTKLRLETELALGDLAGFLIIGFLLYLGLKWNIKQLKAKD